MTALADHMLSGTTTVCRAWIITRIDGKTFGFTDHDVSLTVVGIDCLPESGLRAGAIQSSTGLSVDNSETQGILTHTSINEEDIRAGRWDGAELKIYQVNWSDSSQFELLFKGSLGEINWGDGAFSVELRGLAQALNRPKGRVYQSRCDATLSDTRCKKRLGPDFTTKAEVLETKSNRFINLTLDREFPPKWFEGGRIVIFAGTGNRLTECIKYDIVGDQVRQIELLKPITINIPAGAEVEIQAGCDKSFETCRTKFSNTLNFRGFPNIPGEDWLMTYPKPGRRNDGGSR